VRPYCCAPLLVGSPLPMKVHTPVERVTTKPKHSLDCWHREHASHGWSGSATVTGEKPAITYSDGMVSSWMGE
jgi:hypothetical protein